MEHGFDVEMSNKSDEEPPVPRPPSPPGPQDPASMASSLNNGRQEVSPVDGQPATTAGHYCKCKDDKSVWQLVHYYYIIITFFFILRLISVEMFAFYLVLI